MFKQSRYTPSINSWSKDLEKSVAPYNHGGYRHHRDSEGKHYMEQTRYADDTYCEIGRISNSERTQSILLGIVILFMAIFFVGGFIYMGILFFVDSRTPLGGLLIIFLGAPSVALFMYIYLKPLLVRFLMLPEDIPVRFNRKTGKVYVYDPKLNKNYTLYPWKVLMNMAIPDIKVFDWQDISAFTRIAGVARPQWFAVCKPGTYEVIDYFLFCESSPLYDDWIWILEYMDGSTELSYKSEKNAPHWIRGLSKRFAPPIIWPEGVDKASKAKSNAELAQIEKEYDLVGKMYPEYDIKPQG